MLMIAARVAGGLAGLAHPEAIEEMDRELARVIEDFDLAVNVEALRQTKMNGMCSFPYAGDGPSSVVSCRARAFAWEAQIC